MSGVVAAREMNTMFKKIIICFVVISALLGILGGFIYWTISDLPKINALEEYAPIESSRVYSSDGKIIAELYIERRTFVPHYKIPEHVKKAFISVEDIRFYTHPGVDIIGIVRALWHDIKARGIVEGGSTITQQLARMLFLNPDRSIGRKIKEAALSIQIEKRYTKNEILGMYLNQAYFGTRAYGIEAASQTYFGKSSQDVTIAEAALLASLPKAPSVNSPFRNPEKARERRTMVLNQMLNHEFITPEQYEEAVKTPLPVTPHFRKYDAPYFIETLRQNLEEKYGHALYTSGYRIYSSLDSRMQQIAEEAVSNGIASLEKRVAPGVQAALLAIDTRTGHIKAMVGGTNFWENQFNRSTQALRQPGSAFKPFVYLTAIENGMTSDDIINDSPISFRGASPGQIWCPRNYDGKYHGSVTLKTALAKSLNAATVRLASHLGIKPIIETAQRLGIKSKFPPYLPVAIGASAVSLSDMAFAYSTFASGNRVKPVLYERVVNRDGVVVEEKRPGTETLLSKNAAEQMRILLRATIEQGTGYKAGAGKSGRSDRYRS